MPSVETPVSGEEGGLEESVCVLMARKGLLDSRELLDLERVSHRTHQILGGSLIHKFPRFQIPSPEVGLRMGYLGAQG